VVSNNVAKVKEEMISFSMKVRIAFPIPSSSLPSASCLGNAKTWVNHPISCHENIIALPKRQWGVNRFLADDGDYDE
jgi:hypothetical protein